MNNGVYRNLRLVYQKPQIRVPAEVLLSVFASLFLIMVAIRPTLVTVTELKKKIEDQVIVETKLDTKIKKLIQARKQLDENESNLPLFERAVPENYTYANLAKKIEIIAAEEMIDIESLVFSSVFVSADEGEKNPGVVKEFTISFAVVANEPTVVSFLTKIENLDRALTISAVEITKVKEREVLQNKLRASGKISGYYLINTQDQQ
ncbi:type 4a pilus biogenesis protein PilO [Patescibacteria group bacterium]|nr:type 4a pilus biogenesis protein PilO [Patescibacteria group bacterium]